MTKREGSVWALIQAWRDTFAPFRPPSQREIAEKVGVDKSKLTEWRWAEGTFPNPDQIASLARVIRTPERSVLEAFLEDHGYVEDVAARRHPTGKHKPSDIRKDPPGSL